MAYGKDTMDVGRTKAIQRATKLRRCATSCLASVGDSDKRATPRRVSASSLSPRRSLATASHGPHCPLLPLDFATGSFLRVLWHSPHCGMVITQVCDHRASRTMSETDTAAARMHSARPRRRDTPTQSAHWRTYFFTAMPVNTMPLC